MILVADVSPSEVDRSYKGYTISGSARIVFGWGARWSAEGSVLLVKPASSLCLLIAAVADPLLVFDDEAFATLTGCFLAELAVDHLLPPPAYYLTSMNVAWAVDIIRRSAEDCKIRNIQTPKLYEALDYLEELLEKKNWLVRRYRRALRGDRRDNRAKEDLLEELIVTTRGFQLACAELIVNRMNELAFSFRENKIKIDRLRRVLELVRQPVRRDSRRHDH